LVTSSHLLNFELVISFILTFQIISVVYLIWYGNCPATSQSIVQNFVNGIGATPWWAITKAYGGTGKITFKNSTNSIHKAKTLHLELLGMLSGVQLLKILFPWIPMLFMLC
jgi:hypothetical protein